MRKLLILLLLCAPCYGQILSGILAGSQVVSGGGGSSATFVQSRCGGVDGAVDTINSATGSSDMTVTSGHFIGIFARNGTASSTVTLTDTQGNTVTTLDTDNAQNPNIKIAWTKLTASGAGYHVNAAWGAGTGSYPWVCAVEISGQDGTTPVDVHGTKEGTTGVDLFTNAFSTAMSGEVVLVAVSQSGFETYTAGSNFTIINGTFPTNAGNFGGLERYTPSAPQLTSFTGHITAAGSASLYTIGWLAVK